MDTTKMAFPMIALGKCVVAGAEYAPDAVFDAKSEKTKNFLVKIKAARPFRLGENVAGSVEAVGGQTDALQAEFAAASPTEKLKRLIPSEVQTYAARRRGSSRTVGET